MVEHLSIRAACEATPLIESLQRITTRVMIERGWPRPVFGSSDGRAAVELAIVSGVPPQGFRIESGSGGLVRLVAGDERGLLYGMGKFLRQSCMEGGVFKPCTWRGTSIPQSAVRGIYFATHFHNFYQEAPLAEVERYVEDLALWGINALTVWFDMHHFKGIDDPDAVVMLARLKALLRAARGVGMTVAAGCIANEGYSTTPVHLRATATGRAHYGVEICVATPEGEALVLDNLRGVLETFQDVGLDRIGLWPYDQGGCSCPACAPWGSNGMLKVGEKVARLFRSFYPDGKVVYATWLFDYGSDQGEWEGLAKAFRNKPDWVDFVQADSHDRFPRFPLERGVPGGLPLLNFPEISMYGMAPWGGFGANPLLRRFSALWGEVAHLAVGGFPYSEGIFEDINKAAYAHFYWTGRNDWHEAMEEYARFEFGGAQAETVFRILDILESNHGQVWLWPDTVKLWGCPEGAIPLKGYPGWMRMLLAPTASVALAEEAAQLSAQAEAVMPEWAKRSWRWRIVRLRAFLDRELLGNGGDPTPACADAFRELESLYFAQDGEATVSPPVPGRDRRDTSAA
ncbi:MAG: hypothetical protein HQ559_12095 [Lentisphaerae bacterium]|nr:hypothetical protein [Lentisphaerota bacterium]